MRKLLKPKVLLISIGHRFEKRDSFENNISRYQHHCLVLSLFLKKNITLLEGVFLKNSMAGFNLKIQWYRYNNKLMNFGQLNSVVTTRFQYSMFLKWLHCESRFFF